MKKQKKRNKRPKKVVENEFSWMIEQSKGIDKHLKKIHNGLRTHTLEQLIYESDHNMNQRYRKLYNFRAHYDPTRHNETLQDNWVPNEYITNLDKNIHNGRVRHNILMAMYDKWYNNLPFFKRMFTKKLNSGYYETTEYKSYVS